MAKDNLDELASFGPPPIQTAEDAVMAFLRKEITEDQFREACSRYGVEPGTLFNPHAARVERVDAAYEQQIPEDIYRPVENPEDNLKARQEGVKEKEKARADAIKTNEVPENAPLPKAQVASTK